MRRAAAAPVAAGRASLPGHDGIAPVTLVCVALALALLALASRIASICDPSDVSGLFISGG